MGGFLIALGGGWLWADFGPAKPTWFARKKYRREVLGCLETMMEHGKAHTFPAIDEAIDAGFKEQWCSNETAVLYAGNLLAREIAAMPDTERRQRIGQKVRRWLSEPPDVRFKALLPDQASIHGDMFQWHVQWALDFVRRLRENNTIDQGTQDWFNEKVCGPLWREAPKTPAL